MVGERILASVYLSFGSHGSQDAVYIPRIKDEVREFFSKQGLARRVYLKEGAPFTSTEHSRFQGLAQLTGSLFDANIAYYLPQNLLSASNLLKFKVEAQKIRSEIMDRLQPNAPKLKDDLELRIFSYRELIMLDELREEGVEFEHFFETLPDTEARQVERGHDLAMIVYKKVFPALSKGDLTSAITNESDYIRYESEEVSIRNRGYVRTIVSLINDAFSEDAPIAIYARVGSAHFNIFNNLNKRLKVTELGRAGVISLGYSADPEISDLTPEEKWIMAKELDPKRTITKEDSLRAILGRILQNLLANKFSNPEATQTASAMLKQLTLPDIESLLKSTSRVDLTQINQLILNSVAGFNSN